MSIRIGAVSDIGEEIMSIGVGSSSASLQFLQQTQRLSQQSIQAQQDNSEQSANSLIKRVGSNTVKNQQIAVDAFQQQGKRASAIDLYV